MAAIIVICFDPLSQAHSQSWICFDLDLNVSQRTEVVFENTLCSRTDFKQLFCGGLFMLKKSFLVAGLLLIAGLPVLAGDLAPRQVLQAGSHCVAWRTTKTLALVSQHEVVGTSCQVSVVAKAASGGKYSATVSIPISSFNSQEADRDKEVLKILKASTQPNLLFTTQALSQAQWTAMLAKGNGTVRGNLAVAGKSFPLTAGVKIRKSGGHIEVYGSIRTRFTALGITPPEVGPGGAIAKVPDYLELHFNLNSDKVQNFNIVK
jgi:polyisoprenoid-binding protein YceI